MANGQPLPCYTPLHFMVIVNVIDCPFTCHARLKSPSLIRFMPGAGDGWGDALGAGLACAAGGAGLAKGDGTACKKGSEHNTRCQALQSCGTTRGFTMPKRS